MDPRGEFVALYGNGTAISCRISYCVALVKVNSNKESTRGSIIKVHMQIQLLRHKSVDSYAAELSVDECVQVRVFISPLLEGLIA